MKATGVVLLKKNYGKLSEIIRRDQLALARYRANRVAFIEQFVGDNYSENGSLEEVPVNVIGLYVTTVLRDLIAKNPRVMLSTFQRQHKPMVDAMQSWANKQIEALRFADCLQRVVTDALFSIGILKIGIATPSDSATMAWNLVAGSPFARAVDLDDFVVDMHARDWNSYGYIGHRYRVTLDSVIKSKFYNSEKYKLVASTDPPYDPATGGQRANIIGRSLYASQTEEFEPMVDLWEIYFPRHRVLVTFADDQMGGPMSMERPLRVQPWIGPDSGPYKILAFGTVPGNLMPKAPIMDLYPLHMAANRTYRKIIATIARVKEITGVKGGADADGNRVMKGNDGDILKLDDPQNFVQLVFGGNALNTLTAISTMLLDRFSYQAGNMDMAGGLAPQSKTLGQDRLLAANATKTTSAMQTTTVSFVEDALEAMCWYWWHDPRKVMRVGHSVPSVPDLAIQRLVTPDMRRAARFVDLDIRCDPYSMQHSTPETRTQFLMQIVTEVIAPMLPLFQQQGVNLDLASWMRIIGELKDEPRIAELLTINEPILKGGQGSGGGGDGGGVSMPAATKRTYERVNTSEATPRGTTQNTVAGLLGMKTGGNNGVGKQPVMSGR